MSAGAFLGFNIMFELVYFSMSMILIFIFYGLCEQAQLPIHRSLNLLEDSVGEKTDSTLQSEDKSISHPFGRSLEFSADESLD